MCYLLKARLTARRTIKQHQLYRCLHETKQGFIFEVAVTTIQEGLIWYMTKKRIVYLQRTPLRGEYSVESGGLLRYMFKYVVGEASIYYLQDSETFGPGIVKTMLT